MLKKIYYVSVLMGIILFSFVSCSDDNDPVVEEQELEKVINKLEGMTEVGDFVDVLKKATDINFGEDAVTVFAVLDKSNPKSTKTVSSDTLISANNIKRHLVKGTHNFSSFTGDSLLLESLGGDLLIVTKYEGKTYINGIAMISTSPVTAGKSHIYKVDAVIPTKENVKPTLKYTSNFIVYECNEEWSPEAEEKKPSANAKIYLFRLLNSQYVAIDSMSTDHEGRAEYKHSYTDLYYTVVKGNKHPFYDGYQVVGLFTSQAEIEDAPQYPSLGLIANPKPGSVKVADINGDGRISGDDKFLVNHFILDVEDTSTREITIISAGYEPPSHYNYNEKYSQITSFLHSRFVRFVEENYNMDDMLIIPDVQYPALQGLPDLWSIGYSYINALHEGKEIFSNDDCPDDIEEKWAAKEVRYDVEMAYIYSCLVNYYGGVSIITASAEANPNSFTTDEPGMPTGTFPPRSTEDEVYDYINMLTEDIMSEGDLDNRCAAAAIAMRVAANRKMHYKVRELAQYIMNSEKYALTAGSVGTAGNVFLTETNSETILGGYYLPTDSVHAFVHPIRYAEVLLTYAESSVELGTGNQAEINMTINQLLARLGLPSLMPGLSQSETRSEIRKIYKIEYPHQALGFMTLKRWGTFNEVLGGYGATDYNKVVPIPSNVLNQYNKIIQNPGYL